LDADNAGIYTSVALGTDGRALIAYTRSNTALKVAHCDNIACTSATTNPLDTGVFSTVDLAIRADGFGLISYFDTVNNDLKVAHCDNTACSSATITPLDTTSAGGGYTSIAIGADGLGLIAYNSGNLAGPGGDVVLKVAHCGNPASTSATIRTLDAGLSQPGQYIGGYPAVAIGVDGLALISYQYHKTREEAAETACCLDGAPRLTSPRFEYLTSCDFCPEGDLHPISAFSEGGDLEFGISPLPEPPNDRLRSLWTRRARLAPPPGRTPVPLDKRPAVR
jgi:hypothetical protein